MSATPTVPRRERLQRSELAVPATSERFFAKACASEADVVFLDLEDAVAIRLKDEARHRAIEAINGLDWGDRTLAVRINGLTRRGRCATWSTSSASARAWTWCCCRRPAARSTCASSTMC